MLLSKTSRCPWFPLLPIQPKIMLLTSPTRFEPPHDKTNNVVVRPAKTQISLGIRYVWTESLLSAWRKLGSLATHLAHSEDSDQTGQMPRLIWVFAVRTLTLLILSRGGSYSLVSVSAKFGFTSRENVFPLTQSPTSIRLNSTETSSWMYFRRNLIVGIFLRKDQRP